MYHCYDSVRDLQYLDTQVISWRRFICPCSELICKSTCLLSSYHGSTSGPHSSTFHMCFHTHTHMFVRVQFCIEMYMYMCLCLCMYIHTIQYSTLHYITLHTYIHIRLCAHTSVFLTSQCKRDAYVVAPDSVGRLLPVHASPNSPAMLAWVKILDSKLHSLICWRL